METWEQAIPLMQAGYHREIVERVGAIRTSRVVYPPPDRVLYALQVTPFPDVRVVIVGQDPYHGEGQAHGLAFSVPAGVKSPPSLRNIFKEVVQDVCGGKPQAFSTDLTRWAKQGVLLLNAVLTVEAGNPGSHRKLGWRALTDQIIERLSQDRKHLVFLLWGAFAQSKRPLIDLDQHLVLVAPHPSPLSARRGFFGCGHFSKANQYLAQHGQEPIGW